MRIGPRLRAAPKDQAAVDAAKIKAEAATKARATECQGYQNTACRKKQGIETKALSELSELSQEKTATDHARVLQIDFSLQQFCATGLACSFGKILRCPPYSGSERHERTETSPYVKRSPTNGSY